VAFHEACQRSSTVVLLVRAVSCFYLSSRSAVYTLRAGADFRIFPLDGPAAMVYGYVIGPSCGPQFRGSRPK